MDRTHFQRAIAHLAELGDTDILPPLFEYQFYGEAAEAVIKKLLTFPMGTYAPVGAFEVLSPKTQTSFRITHQLYPTDSLLLAAAAIAIAPAIDQRRLAAESGAFSYRFDANESSPSLFLDSNSYHDWLVSLKELCEPDAAFSNEKIVLETDISDFYGRIYFHRIEHVLDDIEAPNATRKIIENVIKSSRARQSYGLPVGGAASRILAEGVLIDVDEMLHRGGIRFTRFVDDFRIIVDSQANGLSALCRLAEYLMLTEGLSLNAAKTRLTQASSVIAEIEGNFSEIFTEEERDGLDRYLQAIYDGEDGNSVLPDDLDAETLIKKLDKAAKSDTIDYTSVKLLLRALRTSSIDNSNAFVTQFATLLYHLPRDFCMLVGALAQRAPVERESIAETILGLVRTLPFRDLALVRIWVAHLFVAGALPITDDIFGKLPFGDTTIEKRQRILLKARLADRAFFKEAKTQFGSLSEWEKPAMLLGASCLATSEYETWLGTCKEKVSDILCGQYISWLRTNRADLIKKLDQDFTMKTRRQRWAEEFAAIDWDTLLEDFAVLAKD